MAPRHTILILIAVTLVQLVQRTYTFPTGIDESPSITGPVCTTLFPLGHGVAAQTSASPFSISTTGGGFYTPGLRYAGKSQGHRTRSINNSY